MVTFRPEDPELPGLIGLQERDDAQMQLAVNVWDRERQYEAEPDQEEKLTEKERQLLYRNPCGWYSEQVRAWIGELAKQGVTSVIEQYSTGIFDTVQREIILREELESYPSIQNEMEAFERDQQDELEALLRKQREQLKDFQRARQDLRCGKEGLDNFLREQTEALEEFIHEFQWDGAISLNNVLLEESELQREQAGTDDFQPEQQEKLETFTHAWEKGMKAVEYNMKTLWMKLQEQPSQPGQTSDTINSPTTSDALRQKKAIQAQMGDILRSHWEKLEHFRKDQREALNKFLTGQKMLKKLG